MADTYQLQRHETSLFNGRGYTVEEDDGYATDGSDLYVERALPDDIRLAATRLETHITDIEAPYAVVIADEVLLDIMQAFYDAGEDFHIHQNGELRAAVKQKMKDQIADVIHGGLPAFVTDTWLDDRLAPIRGFPPDRYEDPFPSED